MLALVSVSSALTIVLIVAGWCDDRDFVARGERARVAILYRAQERWAAELDRGADRRQAADDRLVA